MSAWERFASPKCTSVVPTFIVVDPAMIQAVGKAFQQFKQVLNEGKNKGTYGLHVVAGSFPMPNVILGYREAIYVIDEPSLNRLLTTKHGAEAQTADQQQVAAVVQTLLNGSLKGLQLAPTMLAKAKKESAGPFMTNPDFEAAMMGDYARYALIDAGFLRESESRTFLPFGTPLVKLPSIMVVGGSFD